MKRFIIFCVFFAITTTTSLSASASEVTNKIALKLKSTKIGGEDIKGFLRSNMNYGAYLGNYGLKADDFTASDFDKLYIQVEKFLYDIILNLPNNKYEDMRVSNLGKNFPAFKNYYCAVYKGITTSKRVSLLKNKLRIEKKLLQLMDARLETLDAESDYLNQQLKFLRRGFNPTVSKLFSTLRKTKSSDKKVTIDRLRKELKLSLEIIKEYILINTKTLDEIETCNVILYLARGVDDEKAILGISILEVGDYAAIINVDSYQKNIELRKTLAAVKKAKKIGISALIEVFSIKNY